MSSREPLTRVAADSGDPQDCLYTLLTRDPDGAGHARVIGSLVDYRFAPQDPDGVQRTLASPTTRIVSLTITEGGYDAVDTPRQHDVFTYLTDALRRRRDDGIPPFTVMSCDNIEHNGDVACAAVIAAADRVDPTLAEWISRNVAFPNSMVDRITPATTPEVIAAVRDDYGVDDAWPIQSESFTQWVIEDRFSNGRPPLQDVGVSVVADVAPYEMMKLRLLNASPQIMSYLGLLAGFRYVHDVMDDEDLGRFVMSYMRTEAAPTLAPVPGVDLGPYIDQLGQRFSGKTISDTLDRQIVDASVRIPKFVLPVIRDRLAADAPITHAALALAAWCTAYEDPELTMVDRASNELRRLSWADHDSPGAFVANPDVFGDLASNVRLRVAYQQAKRNLRDLGPRGAIRAVSAPATQGGR
jgi:mannitol 2-dehydrogenase